MRIDRVWDAPEAAALGAGLVALDVVLNERRQSEPRLWTGGSCGNVLAILAYLGWTAYPVARLAQDSASRLIRKDLKRWGIEGRLLSLPPCTPTPIIVHRLRRTSQGENFHSFSLNCPDCGQRLPSFRPVPSRSIAQILELPKVQFFFADRVSAGTVALAERAAAGGAVILFEPSSVGDEGLFQRMLKLTHVLKYSNDRLPVFPLETPSTTCLEVQTLGEGGLRYRARIGSMTFGHWIHCEPYLVPSPRDTGGAGDWCTAGIVHVLGKGGVERLRAATPSRIQTAMSFGQALASWNCGFEGARGGMYQVAQSQFRRDVETILRGRAHVTVEVDASACNAVRPIAGVCSSCRREDRRSVLKRLHAAS